MLKVELHTHTSDDPLDRISYSAIDLINRAAALEYDALAITLHDRQLDVRHLTAYASERRIVLIPGIERTVEGKHVLLLNFRGGAEDVQSFDDVRALKERLSGLVIAPHPFFPTGACLGRQLSRHADLFDAVEWNAMFTARLNFNVRAARWASGHGKPLVGNCDVHQLEQLGTTYSLVDAERSPEAICQAIAAGRVQVVSRPLSCVTAARIITKMLGAVRFPNAPRRTIGVPALVEEP